MTVRGLKDLLEENLEILEQYDDELEIPLECNTYFLGHPNMFLGVAGYNGGYLALDWLDETLDKAANSNDDEDEE